jgi:hypothetical protein
LFRQNFGDLPAKCADLVPDLTTASAVAEEITTIVHDRLESIRNA